MRRAAAVLAACLLLAAACAAVSTAQSKTARAVAALAGGYPGAQVEVAAEGGSSERREGAVEVGGLRIRGGEASARSALGGTPKATAVAVARSVSALDGVVTAYGVRRTATATPDGTSYGGRVTGLKIGDRFIGDVSANTTYDLPDHSGRVVVNHGTIGLRILMRKDGYGLPEGADVRIAVAEASATGARAKPSPTATATPDTSDEDAAKARRKAERAAERAARRERRRQRIAAIVARLTGPGFQFPVFGDADVANDFNAPRAEPIGDHQGNDIFAPFGTPVVAVADGTLSKVGTLPISGNRLWLTTAGGDAFFYAHLSSFSPAAVDGRRVKAGTVLGYTGNTGDAEPTPPHVHFEIHPGGEAAKPIDPNQILMTWLNRRPLVPGGEATGRPGALVEVRDFIAGE